jgi:dihydroorotate dehydrogenase
MLYRLIRPLLFALDPEQAHEIALGAVRLLARSRWAADLTRQYLARPRPVSVRVAGLDFPSPVGLAAGLDKNAEAPLGWWALGFGFAEFGTVTPRPQAGNLRPRLFRYAKEQALVNRLGFNNEGAQAVAARLGRQAEAGLRPPFPVGVSIGKNAATPREQARDDYRQAVEVLAPHADFLAVNVSSPNTPGLRDLQDPEDLHRLLGAVVGASSGRPVFVKLAPELEGAVLSRVVGVCLEIGAAGIIATNTLATNGRRGFADGGLSGRPRREVAVRRVAEIRNQVGDKFVIVGCGGIDDAASARAMFYAGADLIQLYTGVVFEGPFLPSRLTRELAADEIIMSCRANCPRVASPFDEDVASQKGAQIR